MIIESTLVISFASWLGSKIADKGFEEIYSKLTKNDKFDKLFLKCVNRTADKFEEKYPDILGNSISYFFTQEEVFDELCKLLFINQKIDIEVISEAFYEAALPNDFIFNFITELKSDLSSQPEFQELLANKELFIAVKGISKDIKELSTNSSLTLEEIKKIKAVLEKRFKSKFSLESFLTLYMKNIVNNLGSINFIGLGIDPSIKKGKRKEIDSLFVKPLFRINSKRHLESEQNKKIPYHTEIDEQGEKTIILYEHLFDRPYNFVILGKPGAGKSLLIRSIICNIAKKKKNHFFNKRITTYIPFRIELKNYLALKKRNGGNILKYLTYSLEEEYSVPSILEENLAQVFKMEKVIIFFDGLDEIFNVSDKISVKNDIQNFHNLFPKVRSITTSRFIGYSEVKFDEECFCELNILSFQKDQIENYVKKWFCLEEEDQNIRNAEVSDFLLKKDKIDKELISNPLLLSLIVILYRNNLRIPESKLEIYQSCTNTLVDKWDAAKNLEIKLDKPILQKKEPILADLAFWQYEKLSTKTPAITYRNVKNEIAKSLIRKKVADEFNSEQLAESFLNYALKRSIYFENNFTHKTFLEYYTAYWIYSNIEKKHNISKRNQLLTKYISNPFWYIVLELLLNMIDKDQPDTEIIDNIFKKQLKNTLSIPFLIYIVPNIFNISTEQKILLYKSAIEYLLQTDTIDDKRRDLFNKIVNNSLLPDQESLIFDAIQLSNITNREFNFYILINEIDINPRYTEKKFDFSKIIQSKKYNEIVNKNPYLYHIDKFYNYNKLEAIPYVQETLKFLSLFGPTEILKKQRSYYDNYLMAPFLGYFFHFQFRASQIENFQNNIQLLIDKGLTYLMLIKYFCSHDGFFEPSVPIINYFCNNITSPDISDVDKLLDALVIRQFISKKNYFNRNKLVNLDLLSLSSNYKRLFHKLSTTNDIEKVLAIIIMDLKIQGDEVDQLKKIYKIEKYNYP